MKINDTISFLLQNKLKKKFLINNHFDLYFYHFIKSNIKIINRVILNKLHSKYIISKILLVKNFQNLKEELLYL